MIANLVRTDKPLWTDGWSVYPYSPKLERLYNFESRFDEVVPLHVKFSESGVDYIRLPRALCPVSNDDRRDFGTPVSYPKKPIPRSTQVEIFSEIEKAIKAKESGVLVAPTGFGKTYLGYKMAYEAGVRTLIVTTKEDIFEAWVTGAQVSLGLVPSRIGVIRQDKCEVVETDFVVALIQSLSKTGKYPDWITKGFGLVIFDEVHRLPAEHFKSVAGMFPAQLRWGLSASPYRVDGKEDLFFAHIGPVRLKATVEQLIPKVLIFKSNWVCPRVLKQDNETGETRTIRLPHQAGQTTHVEKMLAIDKDRNIRLGTMIVSAYKKSRVTVVFSSLHTHLHAIEKVLKEAGIPKKDIGYYIGATTAAEKKLREKSKTKPIILTTFSMMSEGTSIDWMDTAVLATPRANVLQPIGRIRREWQGKQSPVVMDLVDEDSHVFKGYAASRLKWYKKLGCEIVEM